MKYVKNALLLGVKIVVAVATAIQVLCKQDNSE